MLRVEQSAVDPSFNESNPDHIPFHLQENPSHSLSIKATIASEFAWHSSIPASASKNAWEVVVKVFASEIN